MSEAVEAIVAAHQRMFKNVGPTATVDHSMRCMELAASLWSSVEKSRNNPFSDLRGAGVGGLALLCDNKETSGLGTPVTSPTG